MDSGQWAVGNGRWAVNSGQEKQGQWAVGNEQWAMGSVQYAITVGIDSGLLSLVRQCSVSLQNIRYIFFALSICLKEKFASGPNSFCMENLLIRFDAKQADKTILFASKRINIRLY